MCVLNGSTNGVSVSTSVAGHVVGTLVTSGSRSFVVATDNTVAAKPPTCNLNDPNPAPSPPKDAGFPPGGVGSLSRTPSPSSRRTVAARDGSVIRRTILPLDIEITISSGETPKSFANSL